MPNTGCRDASLVCDDLQLFCMYEPWPMHTNSGSLKRGGAGDETDR